VMNARRLVSDMRLFPPKVNKQPSVGSPRVQPATAWAGRSSDSDAHPTLARSGHRLLATEGEGECAASLMLAGLHDVSDDSFLAQLLTRLQTMQSFH
jgi:hypothetical protein